MSLQALATTTALSLKGLRKSYGRVEAVRGLDIEVSKGEIFGLIGPDGAGKTSTFHILSGVMPSTSGDVVVLGTTPKLARSRVGYLTQVFSLYLDLSVEENLTYMGSMRRLSPQQIAERSTRYLSLFDMQRFRHRLAGSLSGGMKQKLALTSALLTEPELLLLDEPTTGVDPVSRREFWDTLAQLSGDGMTIIVATPYLDEAERCTRVALMCDGTIHKLGTPAELRDNLGLHRLELRMSDLSTAEDRLFGHKEIADVQRFGDRLDVMVADLEKGKETIHKIIDDGVWLEEGRPTLENVFVAALRAVQPKGLDSVPRPERRNHARNDTAIGAQSLRREFGDFVAVAGIDLEIRYGEIYGLLGANGAGKTTTIKMLCGLLEPSAGEIRLAGGKGPSTRTSQIRQKVGYMSQKFSLYDDLTISQNLDFFAGVYGVARHQVPSLKAWVLDFAGLQGQGQLLTGSLPGGWKQRVAFGAAIMHDPSVVFLDEPTSGVDPIARRAFWREINALADRGVAVLVTTHYLEEAEQCNRLGFMVAGEIVAEGTPTGVKAAQDGHLLEFFTNAAQRSSSLLKARMESWRVSLFGDRLHVVVDGDPQQELHEIKELLVDHGVEVQDAHRATLSLEDVFIRLVEEARLRGKVGCEDSR